VSPWNLTFLATEDDAIDIRECLSMLLLTTSGSDGQEKTTSKYVADLILP